MTLQLLIKIFIYLIISSQATEFVSKKIIRIGVFLEEDDYLTEIAFNSSITFINMKTNYEIVPLIYKINENDLYKVGNIACEMLEYGIAAIFGPNHSSVNEIVESLSLNLKIPQFQTFWNPNLESFFTKALQTDKLITPEETFNFNLYPNPTTLSKAIAILVRENDWKSYTIIYENNDGLVRLQEVLKAHNPINDPPVTFRKLESGPDHRSVLKQVQASGVLQIILDCNTDHIMDILLQAKEVRLLEEYHSYILTSLDAHTLDWSKIDTKANITTIRLLDPHNIKFAVEDWKLVDHKQHNQISTKLVKIKTALIYDAINLFISSYAKIEESEDLLVTPQSCFTKNKTFESSNHLSSFILKRGLNKGLLRGPLSGPIAFNHYGQRIKFKLEILELSKHDFRITGIWDSQWPDKIHSVISFEDREKEVEQQLKGRTFRVVSRIDPPYFTYRLSENNKPLHGNARFEGYAMDVIDGICNILNCNYTFEKVPDNKYGRYNAKTKEWDGLIRHLLDRKADLAICDLTITYERRRAVDFTNPFMTLGISILYAKAVKAPPELLSFTNPLSLDVWLYMATTYMIMSLIIYLTARLNPNEWENPHPCNPNPEELENIWNVKNCFWLTLGSIMAQGCDLLPKGISTRIVSGMWWFFSLIMTACYTANLAAFLTMERMGPSINSAEDLASQTKIKYGCVKDGATSAFFKDTNVSTYHRMWVQMEGADPSVFVNRNKDGVKRVLASKRKYAFLMESTSIEYEMQRNCELMQVGGWLDTKGYGIAMPTNAPYRKAINHAILKMQEMGKLKQLKDKWWIEKNEKGSCKEDKTSDELTATELGLAHVGGVFVVLAIGIGVALIIAIAEFLWNINKIAVAQHISFKNAFEKELTFVIHIWERKKAVAIND